MPEMTQDGLRKLAIKGFVGRCHGQFASVGQRRFASRRATAGQHSWRRLRHFDVARRSEVLTLPIQIWTLQGLWRQKQRRSNCAG
jgi:hypothetical protein